MGGCRGCPVTCWVPVPQNNKHETSQMAERLFHPFHALPVAVGSRRGQVNRDFRSCRIALSWNGASSWPEEFKQRMRELLAIICMAHSMHQVCHDHNREIGPKVLSEMTLRWGKGSWDSDRVTLSSVACAKMHSRARPFRRGLLRCSFGETGEDGPAALHGSAAVGFLVQKPNTVCARVCVIGNRSERGQWYKRACLFEVWPYKWFAMSLDHFHTLQANVLRPQNWEWKLHDWFVGDSHGHYF